jgi:hypothetical protein
MCMRTSLVHAVHPFRAQSAQSSSLRMDTGVHHICVMGQSDLAHVVEVVTLQEIEKLGETESGFTQFHHVNASEVPLQIGQHLRTNRNKLAKN